MGDPRPLPWPTLTAWQQASQTPLYPWQLRALRAMSEAYAGSAASASEPDCPCPDYVDPNRDLVRDQVTAAFAALGAR